MYVSDCKQFELSFQLDSFDGGYLARFRSGLPGDTFEVRDLKHNCKFLPIVPLKTSSYYELKNT